jgi:cytochrome c oxidase subunit 1
MFNISSRLETLNLKRVISKSETEYIMEASFYAAPGRYPGILGWIFSTDHKRIGLLYLISTLSFFFVGVLLGLTMRLELMRSGMHLYSAQTYNAVFTLHGVIMIFFFIIPGIPASLGNFIMPLQLGAPDVAFPKINILSWWLFMIGAALAVLSLFIGGGAPDTGWTFYIPYSVRTGTNISLAVFGVFLIGMSSTLTGMNFLTTIHQLRAPGMTWKRLPLFTWAIYATGWIQLLATPVIAITLLLIIVERFLGVGFFDPAKGGDPILFQHLFWIYSHPAVYVMIIPAMGVISDIIPVFARKTIFGYTAIAVSSLAIAFFGYLVWGHHMFTSGMSDTSRIIFSLLTFLVAVPSGVKVFNWVASMYRGSIKVDAPFLYTLGFIFLFSIGGLTGLVQGTLSTNLHIHGTYFIVAHFHYVIFGGAVFGMFAGLHYWFPKMFGRMYEEHLAKLAFVVLFIGFNMLYFPMFISGYLGMPRRYYDYLPEFNAPNLISTIGSWVLAMGLFILFYNLFHSLFTGQKASANPWGGATLEWQTTSPPPHENFDKTPEVTKGPYTYR